MMYEPSTLEIGMTLIAGTLVAPFYRHYIDDLPLIGNEHVLDFGSGSGVCSRHLARRLAPAGQLTCLDISKRWQQVIRMTLRSYNNVVYRQEDICHLNIPAATFDAILIHFVLHDIPADERNTVLFHLVRVLKKGGRVFIREPLDNGGMPALEIQQRMKKVGLREVRRRQGPNGLAGRLFSGVYLWDEGTRQ